MIHAPNKQTVLGAIFASTISRSSFFVQKCGKEGDLIMVDI